MSGSQSETVHLLGEAEAAVAGIHSRMTKPYEVLRYVPQHSPVHVKIKAKT